MSLRERLAAKQRGSLVYRLAVEDPWPAERRVAEAEAALGSAQYEHPDSPEHEAIVAAREKVAEAKAERDACFEQITMRAIDPDEFEALLALHKPSPEQRDRDPDAEYNPETITAPLLAATVESDLSEADWKGFLGRCSTGERNSLRLTAIGVNLRVPDPSATKG